MVVRAKGLSKNGSKSAYWEFGAVKTGEAPGAIY